jgi:hypothetical protein
VGGVLEGDCEGPEASRQGGRAEATRTATGTAARAAKEAAPSDPDRRVAEWVLQVGGSMVLNVDGAGEKWVTAPEPLPAEPFNIVEIYIIRKEDATRDVDDAALENLRGITRLDALYLNGHPVTDAGLEHLTGHTRLKWLDLKGNTKVTEAGVKKLAVALPGCKIIWDGDVIEPKP